MRRKGRKGVSRPEIGLYYAHRRKRKGRKRHGQTISFGNGESYTARTSALIRLGFRTYADYLKSELWRRVRSSVFIVNGTTCKCCGGGADQVHHMNYSEATLQGRRLDALIPICRPCHEKIEFNPDGSKRSVRAAATECLRLIKSREADIFHNHLQ